MAEKQVLDGRITGTTCATSASPRAGRTARFTAPKGDLQQSEDHIFTLSTLFVPLRDPRRSRRSRLASWGQRRDLGILQKKFLCLVRGLPTDWYFLGIQ